MSRRCALPFMISLLLVLGARAADPPAEVPAAFTTLDLPDWVILPPGADTKGLPWILVVDDAQCPYCMQLHLALVKSRETGDTEIARAVLARMPFPLAIHDEAMHVVMDAFCFEATRAGRPWSAASYLDWLTVEPWKSEAGWAAAKIADLHRDGGLFDSSYEKHRVTSTRRREFHTEVARAESACAPGGCRGDAECDKLCATSSACIAACSANDPPARDRCRADCAQKFVSARTRQFAKVHSDCLLKQGEDSAHARTAASFAWAVAHKVPGTPTVYVGHPSIGFRLLGDSDDLADFLGKLRSALADARSRMAAPR